MNHVRPATPADVDYLVHLQKLWSNEVGFLPRPAHERYAEHGQAMLILANGQEAGFLNWTWRPDGLLRLPQVAIEPLLLRTSLGTELLATLIERAAAHDCTVIRLRSRADLAANEFWPTLGFVNTATFSPPNARRLPIREWTLQLPPTTGSTRRQTPRPTRPIGTNAR